MNLQDAYSTLGVDSASSKDEIKKAFRKLASKYHPDVNKEPDAEKQFKKINEAYQVIESGQDFGPSQPQSHFNINDIFGSSFFSNFNQQIILEDIDLNTSISFKESVLGCKTALKYNRMVKCTSCNGRGKKQKHNGCQKCNGVGILTSQQGNRIFQQPCPSCKGKQTFDPCSCSSGRVPNETSIEVTIPPGIHDQNILRLSSIGNFGGEMFGQSQYSNVNLHIKVIPDPSLILIEDDVFCSSNISLLQALSGTFLTVPTIFGDKEIEIPAKTKNKDEIIIPNLGVNKQGSQRVQILVDYPEDVSSLIESLEK